MKKRANVAMIYRYELLNKSLQDKVDLLKYAIDIKKSIKKYFENNLKDCFINQNYYEFKLLKVLTNEQKREFGRVLLEDCHILKLEIDRLRENSHSLGYFKRKKQAYYAFVDFTDNDNFSNIELIDAEDFKNIDQLSHKAISYIESLQLQKNDNNRLDNSIAINFYMDVFTLKKSQEIQDLYSSNNEGAEVFLIEGYAKSTSENNSITAYNDDNPNNILDQEEENFKITKIVKKDHSSIDSIINCIEMKLNTSDVLQLDHYEEAKLQLEVFNVGQALCTCISNNKEPIIFFDFGMSSNLKHRKIAKFIKSYPPIILSHIHVDHWNGINHFIDAFQCHWYIPNQDLKILFRKKCSQIILKGGRVTVLDQNMSFSFGEVILSTNTHKNAHVHDTGLIFILKFRNKKILIAGDQRYQHIASENLKGLDILVASHHGGDYATNYNSLSSNNIPSPNNDGSLVIYSANQSVAPYYHPTKQADYVQRGWNKNHRTDINSDYIF